MMESLQSALDQIKVEAPTISLPEGDQTPESYKTNTKKEKLLLSYCENFQRQFRQLYADRKVLFLRPVNECGVEKFVCTYLRPTYLPHKELYDFDGCAGFVADYLTYKPLDEPNELPSTLTSPTTVLRQQQGTCFDYAILLCSLLIGVGYNAYCVCGYATEDIALLNQTRKICPLLEEKEQVKEEVKEDRKNRYAVRPPRDLTSQFEKRQVAKERTKIEEEERKKKEEEDAKHAEAEAPPPDKYHGLRYHCWILVLSGKREVAQSFFIEPTTGEDHPLDWDQYLGIETLWNHKNYWVNMQDCSQGVQNMFYDLGDATQWEFFFPNIDKPLLVVPGEESKFDHDQDEDNEDENIKDDFQLPPSWVMPISISQRDLETRCPKGKKTTLYYRAKLEKYAEYLNQDGLVSKLTVYEDTARRSKIQVKNLFKHRKDCLLSRVENPRSGEIMESFAPGRERALKEHVHHEPSSLRPANRRMLFYSEVRVDGLAKRELTATEMIEHFEKRADFLSYRHITYEKPTKKFEPASQKNQRPILKIVEKFQHNPSIPPNSDVAERTFLLRENQIKIVYHLEENRITPSTREYVIPPQVGDQAFTMKFEPDMTTAYQVDPYVQDPKNRLLFEQLEGLIRAQEESIASIRASEKEIEHILGLRYREELNPSLTISVYDVDRNETARIHRQELQMKLAEEERIRKEKEMDYLAPFLARIGDPPTLTNDEKKEVEKDCLQDLRTRLVDMANIIQARFEQETDDLQRKQGWYKSKQGSVTKEEEADYVAYCNEAMFRIHILEQRLNRHKSTAPMKYMDLQKRLKSDPRLAT